MGTYRDPDFPDIIIIDYPGGCPMVVSPHKPHLGGNMAGGDGGTDYSNDLWPWIVEKFNPQYLMDVGSAEGHALHYFHSRGVKVIGLEGLARNAAKCKAPVIVHDLCEGPRPVEGVDFLWCCDVVEHIEEKYVQNILDTFKCAKTVALCHGTEGMVNSGWHHVNNKTVGYWAEKMRSAGYEIDEAATAESHRITQGRSYWPDSGRIWIKK